MLKVKELDKIVSSGINPGFLIFAGEEWYLQNRYLDQFQETLNLSRVLLNKVEDATKYLKAGLVSRSSLLVVREDLEYTKEEKAWNKLSEAFKCNSKHLLVLVYNKLDKRSKFVKRQDQFICDFSRVSLKTCVSYVKRFAELSDKEAEELSLLCGCDIGSCLLEIQKMNRYKSYLKSAGISKTTSNIFSEFRSEISQTIPDITFDFVNAILSKDINEIKRYQKMAQEIKEPEILTLSVLYSNLRAIAIMRDCRPVPDEAGLNYFQKKQLGQYKSMYPGSESIEFMQLVGKLIDMIKQGRIEPQTALNFAILCNLS